MGGTYHPGVLLGVGGVCGLGGEGDGAGGKVGPGQAQGGGTLRSFSHDPENEEENVTKYPGFKPVGTRISHARCFL